jgi:hypothetical protein
MTQDERTQTLLARCDAKLASYEKSRDNAWLLFNGSRVATILVAAAAIFDVATQKLGHPGHAALVISMALLANVRLVFQWDKDWLRLRDAFDDLETERTAFLARLTDRYPRSDDDRALHSFDEALRTIAECERRSLREQVARDATSRA